MPLGTITPAFPYNARLWNEGEIISGAPLRFIASVSEIYGGAVWEQNPPSVGDSIEFSNLVLNSGAFQIIWLVVESPAGSTNVEIFVNDILWMNSIDISGPLVAMREIIVGGNVSGPNVTVRFDNLSNGFVASSRFSIRQVL
jgi:hypothetical protein